MTDEQLIALAVMVLDEELTIAEAEKIIEKTVNPCGKNGRVYLPPEWIGTKIKIVRC